MIFAVPTIYTGLLNSRLPPETFATVRYEFSAASTMPREISARWTERFGRPVYEGCCLTECSPFACYNHDFRHGFGSVCTPVENTEVRILDTDDNEEFWAVEPGIGAAILSTTFGAELIQMFGSEEQKRAILPGLAEGEAIIGTAITEPDAGSDVTMAATTAVKDDGWMINGSKMFATNGTIAAHICVFRLTDPDNPSRHKRHSFILVPTAAAGFSAVKIRGKLGIRASDTAELVLKDVRVPDEDIVGAEGEGFSQLMAFFNQTRLHVCAQAVGLSRAALEEAVRHAKGRVQFGHPLASFQAIQFKIAEMATRIRASRNLYYEAAWAADRGKPDHGLVAMA